MKRVAVLPALVALLVIAVGVKAGWMSALVIGAVAVVVMGGTLLALVAVARKTVAPAVQGRVQHCDCCDQACLMGPVCAPGAEPTTVH